MNLNDYYFQTKLTRLILLIKLLHVNTSLERAANKLGVHKRTVRRDIYELRELGFKIETDARFQYFITEDNCPLCGKVLDKNLLKSLAE